MAIMSAALHLINILSYSLIAGNLDGVLLTSYNLSDNHGGCPGDTNMDDDGQRRVSVLFLANKNYKDILISLVPEGPGGVLAGPTRSNLSTI